MNHISTLQANHPDYLDSIEWVTNADGRPVEYFWYSPWGETLQADNSWRGRFSSPFKFTGHIEDEETGLTYAGARYYPARESQWLSVDAMAEHFPSWTPYHYVHNNPVNLVDPDGRNALPPSLGDFEDGFIWNDNDGSYTFDAETRTWIPNDENSTYHSDLEVVDVTTELSDHEKTMQNPIAKAIHQGQNNFVNHPVTQGTTLILGMFVGVEAYLMHRAFQGAKVAVNGLRTVKATKGVTNFTIKDLNSFRGAKSADVMKWLEKNGWSGVKTNPNRVYNDGMRFTNGIKGEQIRIMTGGPTRSIPAKTGPYMEISIGGKKTVIELFGNPTLK